MNLLPVALHVVLSSAVSASVLVDAVDQVDRDTLVLLHVLFRHGNRTPDKVSLFPNDLYINFTYPPYGYGQLTTKGKKTEYAIGQWLRKNYGHFIPEQYAPDVVSALCTNYKRTKMSLELVLASLFPPLQDAQIFPRLNWQPISFNIEESDGLIGVAIEYCTNYLQSLISYVVSHEAQQIISQYKDLYQKLETYTGMEINTPMDATNIYVTLKSEEDFNLELPKWANGIYPEPLEEASSVYYEFSTANPQLTRFSAGFLLNKIIEDSFAKRRGELPKERKVFLYSAHEYNVGTMLRALNVFKRHVPPFGATMYFEIHNVRGVYGLKLYYQDYKQPEPRLLTIPGCSTFCPLDMLKELVKNNLPGDSDVCQYTEELT